MKEYIPFFKLYTSYVQGSRGSMELLAQLKGVETLILGCVRAEYYSLSCEIRTQALGELAGVERTVRWC